MSYNPFLQPYHTPHNTFPFDKIAIEHFEPAILEGMRRENEEIEAIINNSEVPTFENTLVALENSGQLLEEVTTVMYNLNSAETSDELDDLVNRLSPLLSEHSSNILQNEKLFERIRKVYDLRTQFEGEEAVLLQKVYDNFERSGATLSAEKKERFKAIRKDLSTLSLQFSQNRLKETNAFRLELKSASDIEGLPESFLTQAAETAKEEGKEGWIVTLKAPSFVPFMQYAKRRDLRQQLYMAYNTLCTHNNEYNNFEIVRKIINLRLELAQLLGYSSFSDYALKNRMAEKPEKVHALLNELLMAYRPTAEKEVATLAAYAQQQEGKDFCLEPWDFAYYSQLLKKELYDIDPEVLRPYFQLSKVEAGVFALATRLYGISFKKNTNIPTFHEEVTAYEVFDADGSFLAILYTDYFPRKGKQSGAWMTSYREQSISADGTNHRPHVSLTCNFTRPTTKTPALLTFEEVETLLHEFGHCLHGIFANSRFQSLSGTNVLWDFVELPSQIMENFAIEKEFLSTFATHYDTGEALPDALIDKIVAARNFNIAYACLRQLSFGFLDMAFYERNTPLDADILTFERAAMSKSVLLPPPAETSMTTNFGHIISGGYAAGYYSYKWAEVLDADAFAYFKEQGIFNPEIAQSFRKNILSKGNTEHPSKLYQAFRGKEATIEGLLRRDGISL